MASPTAEIEPIQQIYSKNQIHIVGKCKICGHPIPQYDSNRSTEVCIWGDAPHFDYYIRSNNVELKKGVNYRFSESTTLPPWLDWLWLMGNFGIIIYGIYGIFERIPFYYAYLLIGVILFVLGLLFYPRSKGEKASIKQCLTLMKPTFDKKMFAAFRMLSGFFNSEDYKMKEQYPEEFNQIFKKYE